jgi:uncharacterized protein YoxC
VHPWLQILLGLCLVAVTIALVPAIVALRGVARRAERVLAIVESDLQPLLGKAQGLVEELQGLSQDVRIEIERVGALTRRVEEVADGLGRIMVAVAGFTRAGQVVGIIAGLKSGLDAFLGRLRGHRGDRA